MDNYLKTTLKDISPRYLFFIIIFALIVIYFLLFNTAQKADIFFSNYLNSVSVIFLITVIPVLAWIIISFFLRNTAHPLNYSLVVLSPVVLLLFWRPQEDNFLIVIPLIITLTTQFFFFIILFKEYYLTKITPRKEKVALTICITLYFLALSYIGIQKFNSFSLFNPKDFAIYNQTFWNTVNGRIFQNSTYGSNFACHNTLFFFVLVPFYYVLPHPVTLLILKILFLSISAIPFFFIAKDIFKQGLALPITITFLFYPFIISQGFTAPHEIGFVPFFILFTYLFYRRQKFYPFVFFLILTLSIKEHLALISLMFGAYALFYKRSVKWVLTPVLLGIIWSVFSLLLMLHFQKAYNSHPDAAWFLVNIKNRFLGRNSDILSLIITGLHYSNITSWHNFRSIFLLVSPVGIIPPFLTPVSLLGVPEVILNLFSDRPAMLGVSWHYNVIVSCFILVGTTEGIDKISHSSLIKKAKIETTTSRLLLSVFILFSTLIYSYEWLRLTKYSKNTLYIKTAKQAISLFPKDAFVTVPKNIAVHISNRKKYSLIGEAKEYADYILIDRNSTVAGYLFNNYLRIFNKEGISIFKRQKN